jgi:hypothetical protein
MEHIESNRSNGQSLASWGAALVCALAVNAALGWLMSQPVELHHTRVSLVSDSAADLGVQPRAEDQATQS